MCSDKDFCRPKFYQGEKIVIDTQLYGVQCFVNESRISVYEWLTMFKNSRTSFTRDRMPFHMQY
jgi:hypothetical protein